MAKPFFQNELEWQPKVKNRMCREISPTGGSSSTSLVEFSAKSRRVSELNEAVELSIAASEAVVIAELANNGTEFLSPKSILEVSLRMKEARCQLHLEPLDYSFSETIFQGDAADQLSDLDENAMVDAFEDAGICYPLLIAGPDDLCADVILSQKNTEANILDTKRGYCEDAIVVDTQISENHLEFDTLGNCELKAQDLDIGVCFEDDSVLDIKISGTNLGYNIQQKSDVEGQKPKNDHLTWENLSVENDKVIAFGDGISRKSVPRFYAAECSFLSESSAIGESTPIHKIQKGLEVIPSASSRAMCEDIQSAPSIGNKSYFYDGIGRSQDLMGSSDFESLDPLCSVVPCSISSENVSTNIIYNQKILEATGNLLDSIPGNVLLQGISNITEACAPSSFFSIGQSTIYKGTGVHCKHVPSLKPYSMVVPRYDSILAGNFALHEMNSSGFISTNHKSAGPLKLKESHQVLKESNNHYDVVGINNEKAVCQLSNGEPVLESANPDPCKGHTFVNDTWFQEVNGEKASGTLIHTENEKDMRNTSLPKINRTEDSIEKLGNKQSVKSHSSSCLSLNLCPTQEQGRFSKRVHFSEAEPIMFPQNKNERPEYKYDPCLCTRRSKREKRSCPSISLKEKKSLNGMGRLLMQCKKKMIFLGLEFLLTGYSRNKQMEVESLIRIHGGVVLTNVPLASHIRAKGLSGCTSQQRPIVLSPKMVQTTKFLYGCAIRTWLLNAAWLIDCVQAGRILPPIKYMILQNPTVELNSVNGQTPSCSKKTIFGMLNAMLYGKTRFCTRYSNIIKHGGGQLCKTLQLLVQSVKDGKNLIGIILVDNECNIPRHLKHCALEQNLHITSGSWIVDCLFSGKLLPLQKEDQTNPFNRIRTPRYPEENDDYMSGEI